jgi:hypothetical protein
MALARQPSPQTLSPRPPIARRSPQTSEPTFLGLTHRQGRPGLGLRSPKSCLVLCATSERQRGEDPTSRFTKTQHSRRLLIERTRLLLSAESGTELDQTQPDRAGRGYPDRQLGSSQSTFPRGQDPRCLTGFRRAVRDLPAPRGQWPATPHPGGCRSAPRSCRRTGTTSGRC